MIKAVFFDVGATLLTPAVDEGLVFSKIISQHGISIAPEEVSPHVPAMYQLYEELYEKDESFWSSNERAQGIWIEMYEYLSSLLGIAEEERGSIAEDVYQYYFSADAWKTFDDVAPTLEALSHSGIRMGLISNWDATLEHIINGLGLSHYFETILASAVVQMHKPMPEIFQLALNRLDLKPEEAMHVGDHVTADAWGSAQVGLTPVFLDRANEHKNYEGPGYKVLSLQEIPDILSGLSSLAKTQQ